MNLLTTQEIKNFKKDGAIVLRNKFDVSWIEKLKKGIERDIKKSEPKIQITHFRKRCSSLFRRLLDMGFGS